MPNPLKQESFDIIICGGGTAGCVLAARLSEDPNVSILMLEAGEDANNDARITTPALFTSLYDDPSRDWGYKSEPSPGLHDRKIHHPRGKCIGGSSAINLMAMVYPSKTGLDTWAELGNPGWDWESMAPYYRKFQTHVKPPKEIEEALGIDYLDDAFTGTDGPIKASFPQTLAPLQKAWIDTWKNLQRRGNPIDGVGGFAVPACIDIEKGRRSFAGTEYWEVVKERGNLKTVTGALVERVELEKNTTGAVKATGVVFSVDGERHVAKAGKEVVLCAGTFGSAQILELSGIGSAELCKSLGIENVIDNPNVGENLQDHLMAGPSWEVQEGVQTADQFRDPAIIQQAMQQYQETQTGPLANGGGHTFAYCPLVDFITPEPKETLTQLLDKHLPSTSSPKYKAEEQHNAFIRKIISSPDETPTAMCMVTVQFHSQKEATKDKMSLSDPANFISCFTQLSHPFSRGSTHITSSDPTARPIIKPNYLSHPLDAEILARGIMQCEFLAQIEPLKSFLKHDGKRLPEGQQRADTLEHAIEFGRSSATSNYHPSGTCAMMPLELGGVVSERLVVHGTTNLRVCDASVFPIEPRGNIQTTVYAAAEKGADLIKQDLGMKG